MHFPEKQLLSQGFDSEDASARSTSWSITNTPRHVLKTWREPRPDGSVQTRRWIPATSPMAGRGVCSPPGSEKELSPLRREVMCCHRQRRREAQVAYL